MRRGATRFAEPIAILFKQLEPRLRELGSLRALLSCTSGVTAVAAGVLGAAGSTAPSCSPSTSTTSCSTSSSTSSGATSSSTSSGTTSSSTSSGTTSSSTSSGTTSSSTSSSSSSSGC